MIGLTVSNYCTINLFLLAFRHNLYLLKCHSLCYKYLFKLLFSTDSFGGISSTCNLLQTANDLELVVLHNCFVPYYKEVADFFVVLTFRDVVSRKFMAQFRSKISVLPQWGLIEAEVNLR